MLKFVAYFESHFAQALSQWAKSPKSSLKECVFIVKNTLSQTAFPGILLTGMLFYKRGVYDFELTNAL